MIAAEFLPASAHAFQRHTEVYGRARFSLISPDRDTGNTGHGLRRVSSLRAHSGGLWRA